MLGQEKTGEHKELSSFLHCPTSEKQNNSIFAFPSRYSKFFAILQTMAIQSLEVDFGIKQQSSEKQKVSKFYSF